MASASTTIQMGYLDVPNFSNWNIIYHFWNFDISGKAPFIKRFANNQRFANNRNITIIIIFIAVSCTSGNQYT